MKNFKVSLMAFALMLGVAGAFATTSSAKHYVKKVTSMSWYTVDGTGHTISSTPDFTGEKADVIAEQDCKDVSSQPLCLYGDASSSLTAGFNANPAPVAQKIRQNN
jgi:hypothetical protein